MIIGLVVVAAAYFLFDSLSQPNTGTLKGNFRETAMYRNPNNTGPITRIFAVSVEDPLWNEMRQYGEMMPYTKYGTTTVYFFRSGGAVPREILPEPPHFDPGLRSGCLARYHKNAMGTATLDQFPFSRLELSRGF